MCRRSRAKLAPQPRGLPLALPKRTRVAVSRQERSDMTSSKPTPGPDPLLQNKDFSLILGGPLHQFLRRLHLSDDALLLMRRRVLVISLFCWLPLLVIAALEGRLLPGRATMPFLRDLETHIRFLV